MSGTGYSSLGHLFVLSEKQCESTYKNAVRQVVANLYAKLSGSIVHHDGLRLFDRYFNDVKVTIDSSRAFLTGILKNYEVDEQPFQMNVEKTVWNIMEADHGSYAVHQKYRTSSEDEEDICFKLFCLFNRFCAITEIPLTVDANTKEFLFTKFGMSLSDSLTKNEINKKSTFWEFVKIVFDQKDSFLYTIVRKTYDEYIREVLVEGTVLCRTRSYFLSRGKTRVKLGMKNFI